MGNRYRCAGSASETYINGERTYDRVDIQSINLPAEIFNGCYAELNSKIYISNVRDLNGFKTYSFDGSNFADVAAVPAAGSFHSMCGNNNTLYGVTSEGLYSLSGSIWTRVTDTPDDGNIYSHVLFSFSGYLYLITSPNARDTGRLNYIYRYTGSSWTLVTSFDAPIGFPSCVLYQGAIHILAYYWNYDPSNPNYVTLHKTFNGASINNATNPPGIFMTNGVYVFNNKIRAFSKGYEDTSLRGKAYEYNGTTWSTTTVLEFDGFVNTETILTDYDAVILNNVQYIMRLAGSFWFKITNPIRLAAYTRS